MLILAAGTIELIQMVTSGTADIDYDTATVDHTTSGDTFAARQKKANVASAATTTIVDAPGAGKIGNVKWISARNKHASASNTLTFRHTDGTTTVELFKCTLQAGELVVMNADGVWFVYDVNGGVKVGASSASDTLAGLIQIADQGTMEAGTDVTRAVTSGRQHFHPSACKAWLVAGVTGNILASYNITSLTDTGTGVLTITIATDFSSVDYCCNVSIEATGTTWAVANTRECHVRSATRAVGSIAVDCVDNTATTSLVKDPSTWHVSMFGDQ